MAGKISRDSQNSVQPWLHLLLCARFYQSRCRTLSSACRAVSNRFFFLQFAPDIQSEENIRGCETLSGDANGESNVGGKNYRGQQGDGCGRRESIFSGARGEKRIPQAQQAHQRMPLEGNGALLQPGSRRHGERKCRLVLPAPETSRRRNQGSRRLLERRPRRSVSNRDL